MEEPNQELRALVDETIEIRRIMAHAVVASLPEPLDAKRGTIAIREEHETIRQLLMFGFVGPAIVCCGPFLEHVLEDAICFDERKKLGRMLTKDEERRIESHGLEDVINSVKTRTILTKEEAKKLKSFVNEWRDPYQHGSLGQITEGLRVAGVQMINFATGQKKSGDQLTEEEARPIRHFTKSAKDAQNAIPVFLEIDKVLRRIWDHQGR